MPCNSSAGTSGDYAWDKANNLEHEFRKMKSETDKVTRLLCALLTNLGETDPVGLTRIMRDPELADWWKRHQEWDERNGR